MIAVHSIRVLGVLHGLKTSTLVILRGNDCSDAVSETHGNVKFGSLMGALKLVRTSSK